MMGCSTLGNRPAEQAPRTRHREQGGDAHRSGRLAKEGDVLWVAAEGRDVLSHPLEGGYLVKQAEIGNTVPQEEEALGSQPIVEGDTDDAIAGEARAIIKGLDPDPFEKAPP